MTYQSPYQGYPYPWGGVTPAPQYVPPTPSTYQTMTQPQQPPQQQSTGAAALTGRSVRSAQEVTPQEVPMDGTTAYFPLADGSAVIGKAWAPDGTIKTVRFVPQQEPTKHETPSFEQVVLDRLASIEDMLSKPQRTTRRKVSDDAES